MVAVDLPRRSDVSWELDATLALDADHVTSYARSGGYDIAYQVVGAGPVDVLIVPGFVSNLELHWQLPGFRRFVGRMARFARVILFDKRGTGLSDRVGAHEVPTLDDRADDLRAVLDAADSRSATVIGVSEGAALALRLALSDPHRVDGVVVVGGFDDLRRTEPGELVRDPALIERWWGRGHVLAAIAPTLADDPAMVRLLARVERHSATPAVAARLVESMCTMDATEGIDRLVTPVTVLHRCGDRVFSLERARRLAEAVPRGELVVLPGDDHLAFAGDVDGLVDEIERRVAGQPSAVSHPRSLVSLVMLDVVGSTRRARQLGDESWRDLLERLYETTGRVVAAGTGRWVGTTGDGFLATFDSPSAAVRAAHASRRAAADLGLTTRVGVHLAEVDVLHDGDVAGIGVHVVARVTSAAAPDEVWVSRTVRDALAGSPLRFAPRGPHELAGLDEAWDLYASTT